MPTPISDICFPYQHWHIALYSHAYIYYETFFYCFHQPHFSSSCFHTKSRVVYIFLLLLRRHRVFVRTFQQTVRDLNLYMCIDGILKSQLCLLVSAQKDFMFRFSFYHFFVLRKLTIDTSIYVQNMLVWNGG